MKMSKSVAFCGQKTKMSKTSSIYSFHGKEERWNRGRDGWYLVPPSLRSIWPVDLALPSRGRAYGPRGKTRDLTLSAVKEVKMKFVIIGGDAAGMSAASRAKRKQPEMEVSVLEQTRDVSYSA